MPKKKSELRKLKLFAIKLGERMRRRETGDINGGKCGLVKEWVLEYCMIETQLWTTLKLFLMVI